MGLLRIVGLSILLLRLCNFCADAAPSLVDCVRTVTASDANNDGKLNYAEYLTLLSDLSLRESEENDDNNGDCVLDTTNIGFVTNHLFVEQFRELACLCEEYHDTSIQESEACHNRCQGSDPLVTVASDAYPAAYIVRLCDDVTDVLITACEGERETLFPIESPTEIPTVMPTEIPTETPTLMPTMLPTEAPTEVPTETPTAKPTVLPTETPTEIPTETPTVKPTVTPSVVPSKTPTVSPSIKASVSPSHAPTEVLRATAFPTASPPNPTLDLSTVAPIVVPIVVVTAVPTSGPAFNRDGGTGLAGGTVSSQVDDSISRNHRIVAIALPIFTVSALALFLTILLVQKTAKPLDDFQAFKDEDDDDDYDDDNSNQRKISRQSPRTPATDPTECSDTEPAVLEEGRGCSASYPDVVSVPDAPLDESSARSVPPGCDTDLIHSSPVDSKVRSIGHVEYEYPMDELSPIKMASSKTTNCDLAENDPILPATIPFTAKAAPKIPILAPSPLDKAPRFSLMLRKLKTEFTRRPDECPIVEYTQPLNDALPKSVAAPPPTASSSKLSSASSSPIFLFGDSEDDDDIIKNRSIASSRNSSRRRNGSAFTPIQHRFAEEEQYIAGSGESAGNFDDFGSSTGSSSSSSSSCDSDISGSEHSESASSNQQSDTQEIGRSENMRSERRIEATQVNTTEVAHPETAVSEESSSSSLDGSEVDTSSGSSASILDNHDDWDWRQGEENDQSLQLNQEVETNFNREDASASAFVTVAVGGGFEYHEMAWSTDPDIAGWETFPGNNSFREEDDVHIEESNESFEVVRRGDGVLSEVQKSL